MTCSLFSGWKFFPYREFTEDIIFHSDEMRLKMVFTNLISNAIKYRDNGKNASSVKLKGDITDHQVIITVEDNDVGISESMQSRIFDMFFRAHDHYTGSDLGLYIVKETITKLSGTIAMESTEGKGSQL